LRLVLASNNQKKLAELQALLSPAGVELVAQPHLGISEAEEPHITFIENALAKARHAAHKANTAAIADDSGLCVDALGGAPGVYSAHFAPVVPLAPVQVNSNAYADREARRALQDTANNSLLVERLKHVTNRRARFVSTLVAIRSADDPEPLIAVGRWSGEILHVPRGVAGFGYDPLMFIPSLGRAVAELSSEIKNAHSHRAIAANHMLQLMREVWRLG
jgi:XTP/dITP diphosphohydrolase